MQPTFGKAKDSANREKYKEKRSFSFISELFQDGTFFVIIAKKMFIR
jgi:hypothetical protein